MKFDVQIFDALDSTNTTLREQFSGEAEGYVVQAYQQTKGRGRFGNSWSSPKGNLYISILLKPDCPYDQIGQLAFVAATSIASYLQQTFDSDDVNVAVKWPNDILVNGNKIGGILIETNSLNPSRVDQVIVGIGLNVFAQQADYIKMDDFTDRLGNLDAVRDDLLQSFGEHYTKWREMGFSDILREWKKYAVGIGEKVGVRLSNEHFYGIFVDVDDTGNLILDQDGDRRLISAGEINLGK